MSEAGVVFTFEKMKLISLCTFTQHTMGLLMGGHIRVGMEDNIYYDRGILAQSNAQFVERIVRISHEYGRAIASPSEAREILKLRKV